MKKQLFTPVLIVALTLGTAWAVRGKFGHEQGAAWAGAIGALAVILTARRSDWYTKTFKIILAAAIGWGLSGMMSYGVIVGYGRGSDFGNVLYGLLMLFVLGVLYGFLGGGLFGLALAESEKQKIKWASLLTQMTAFALLTYGLLINQLEWLMTPPRSELWAACLGASIALALYVIRHNHKNVMKVAVWSALGAGFGFAFGNFLQVLGSSFAVPLNMWNVMEYSIGFFGGAGMAYGTFSSEWDTSQESHTKLSNLFPLLFVMAFVPFVVWQQGFTSKDLAGLLQLGGTDSTVFTFQIISLASVVLLAVIMLTQYYRDTYTFSSVRSVFIIYFVHYTFLSFLLTGLFVHPIEQYLYIINIVVILWLIQKSKGDFVSTDELPRRWLIASVLIILSLALFSWILIHSHGELPHANTRF